VVSTVEWYAVSNLYPPEHEVVVTNLGLGFWDGRVFRRIDLCGMGGKVEHWTHVPKCPDPLVARKDVQRALWEAELAELKAKANTLRAVIGENYR